MSAGESPWRLSWRADPAARAIADRHYNRQKPGAAQFVPPGRCLVLKAFDGSAVWVTSWPFALSGLLKIADHRTENFNGISDKSEGYVAPRTGQTSDAAGQMVVIYAESGHSAANDSRFRLAADDADAALRGKHVVVLGNRQAVSAKSASGSVLRIFCERELFFCVQRDAASALFANFGPAGRMPSEVSKWLGDVALDASLLRSQCGALILAAPSKPSTLPLGMFDALGLFAINAGRLKAVLAIRSLVKPGSRESSFAAGAIFQSVFDHKYRVLGNPHAWGGVA